jgi:hypothetical protein
MTPDVDQLAKTLQKLGCPAEKSPIMATQLDRRARMDAEHKGIGYETALNRLVSLMAQGWAATGDSNKA